MGSGVETDRALIEIRRNGHDVADALTAEAKSSHSDLLAIGTHGHREMGDFFMGSVAEGVIRTSPVPVLVVRGH
jgi:nucleotide-binding universal stress UspA family protein